MKAESTAETKARAQALHEYCECQPTTLQEISEAIDKLRESPFGRWWVQGAAELSNMIL